MRFWLLKKLIRFYWWCEWWLENSPHYRQNKPILFDPGTLTGAILISLAISGASLGAQLVISSLLTPKPKQQVKGKLTGDISVTDSIFGAPILRIYGARGADGNAGGVEVGGNVIFASEIRKTQTSVPASGSSGGGKGGRKSPPTIQITYKIDLGIAAGAGPLRLLRMKFNEDTVYNDLTTVNATTPVIVYEAESTANVFTGGAVIADDPLCSNGQKVTGIGLGGKLIFNGVGEGSSSPEQSRPEAPIGPGDPGIPRAFVNIEVFYKSAGDKFCFVKLDGDGGLYSFPDTAGAVASRRVTRELTGGFSSIEFSNPDSSAPDIDRIEYSIIFLQAQPVTGVYNENFPAESPQDNLFLPEPNLTDTNPRERYNGSPVTETNGIFYASIADGANLTWYPGTADQPVDATIAAHLDAQYGSGSTPAFRDTAFASIQNLDFTKYGSLPNIRMVVEHLTDKTVTDICLTEAALAGLLPNDLNLSAGQNKTIRGYFLNGLEAPAKVFEDMATIHNLSFVETSDGQINCIDLNSRNSVAVITEDDLGAYIAEESTEPPVDLVTSTIPDPSVDEIRTLELQFNNPLAPSDYATDRQSYTYPYTASVRNETRQLNVTLLPNEALQIVRRELQKHHLKNVPDAFVLPHKYVDLDAGDCVTVEIEGEMKLRRIEMKNGSAPGIYEFNASSEDIFFISDTDQISAGGGGTVRVPANTVGTIMDLPSLSDAEGLTNGFYVAGCSRDVSAGSWTGATLYRYKGTDYEPVVSLSKPALMGIAGNILADWTSAAEDDTNSLTVDFFGIETPTTVTTEQIADGANRICAGSEIIAVRTWTRNNNYPNRWTGTNLTRRLNQTESKSGLHAIGERIVFLDDAVKFATIDESERDVEREWKFVTFGQRIEDAAQVLFTWEGANKETLKPIIGQLAPATNTSIEIGVNNYSENARYRRIEISTTAEFPAPVVVRQLASEYANHRLKESFPVTRSTNLTVTETRYVRVAHSSNDIAYSPFSDPLMFTFADSGGAGGSGGSGGWDGSGGGGGSGGPCFIASTNVPMWNLEVVAFGEIAARRGEFIGRAIKGYDDDGNIQIDYIDEIFVHTVTEYLRIEFSDGSVFGVTKEHPFWNELRRFVAAGSLQKGDTVQGHRRTWNLSSVISVTPVSAPDGIEVFNLRTRIYHRYFVCDPSNLSAEADDKAVHNLKIAPIDPIQT